MSPANRCPKVQVIWYKILYKICFLLLILEELSAYYNRVCYSKMISLDLMKNFDREKTATFDK